MSRCRSCNAPIMWTVMPDGQTRMPVDPQPAPDGNVQVDLDTYTASGAHPATVLGPLEIQMADSPLHRSHFQTCPDADEWRRR